MIYAAFTYLCITAMVASACSNGVVAQHRCPPFPFSSSYSERNQPGELPVHTNPIKISSDTVVPLRRQKRRGLTDRTRIGCMVETLLSAVSAHVSRCIAHLYVVKLPFTILAKYVLFMCGVWLHLSGQQQRCAPWLMVSSKMKACRHMLPTTVVALVGT